MCILQNYGTFLLYLMNLTTMFKEEIIYPEEIGYSMKLGKDDIRIENISPEVLNVADQSFGKSQETLDANIAIRNLSSGANIKI